MPTTYATEIGGYPAALAYALKIDGQLFTGKTRDSAHTVVRGSNVVTFWEENSSARKNVLNAAKIFNFDGEHLTSGRLSRKILKEIVGLDAKGTYYGRSYRKLARNGFHWHYMKCIPGYHPYLIEFDLKSAYLTSLLKGRTFFYHELYGWQDDSGALENLREIEPLIPKWLRLTMLGIIASHKTTHYRVTKNEDGGVVITPKTISKVDFGAAFNAVHGAILRTYRTLKRVDEIAKGSCARIHTDSFAISPEIEEKKEAEIFELLSSKGFDTSVKASGSAHFINLNEGCIGKKLIGAKHEVESRFREENIKVRREFIDYECWCRWRERVKDIKLNQIKPEDEEKVDYDLQMTLPGIAFDGVRNSTKKQAVAIKK